MTISTRAVGTNHVRTVALGLSLGALVVFAQAAQMDRGTAIALWAAGGLAALASARMWRQKLVIGSDGLVDRRPLRDRRLTWLEVSDFYLGRPGIAGGLCIWVVDVHGSEYSLRSTWTTDRRRDLTGSEKLIKELRGYVTASRKEALAVGSASVAAEPDPKPASVRPLASTVVGSRVADGTPVLIGTARATGRAAVMSSDLVTGKPAAIGRARVTSQPAVVGAAAAHAGNSVNGNTGPTGGNIPPTNGNKRMASSPASTRLVRVVKVRNTHAPVKGGARRR